MKTTNEWMNSAKSVSHLKNERPVARSLWHPSDDRIKQSNMFKFIGYVNKRFGLGIQEYDELYHWSVRNIPGFWAAFWNFAEIRYSSPFNRVVDDVGRMAGARWFEGARLNFAENLFGTGMIIRH